jgi:excisionase family DNA binding protein
MHFYTPVEAAEILKLSKATIYRLVHQRRIGFRKHGSRLVFTEEHLSDFSRAGECTAYISQALGSGFNCDKSPETLQKQRKIKPQRSLKTEHSKRSPSLLNTETRDGNPH